MMSRNSVPKRILEHPPLPWRMYRLPPSVASSKSGTTGHGNRTILGRNGRHSLAPKIVLKMVMWIDDGLPNLLHSCVAAGLGERESVSFLNGATWVRR
jgi:hypothetical protein